MEKDLPCTEDCSKTCGTNRSAEIKDGPAGVPWKGSAILPLHSAASYRRVQSMKKLLVAGEDAELRDQLGQTALHQVILAWPRIWTGRENQGSKFQSALNNACRQAEACLRLLCEHKVNVNSRVEGGSHQTALHLSVRYATLPAVQILTSYGADVNAVDSRGMVSLHMAAGMLRKDIIAYLIRQGADFNKGVTQSGNTPLHLAAVAMAMQSTNAPGNADCITELLRLGADANAVNKEGRTPLHEVCSMGNEDVVDLLLQHRADLNKLSALGENCLFLFLNHQQNTRNDTLLGKLLCLTSPFTVYNQEGHLPTTLTLLCFFKQKAQLLKLTRQPRRLQDICKGKIYLKYNSSEMQSNKDELRRVLPEKLYNFVFNCWENRHNISFVIDRED